ncbi:HAMP domain-containing sensor histidine kinase [Bacillus sp. 31A1R]|uniref:histidine kinase n=1 Tax=Robertmurraya mangrovi TaxID=3098077 RepID=A0ABU5J3I7_9BACI|nr:HAMP domain-containing sensor histidine kinase [Bacillus sp. 31A1R]MDZ5473998.1 HAMP domain-containing sensor histidine kinase [Bacillus sp. 31A1R]
MRIKYFYQQFSSHIGIIVVAFLILSLLFSHYVERLVYENKTEELMTYGENILKDIQFSRLRTEQIIYQYENVLIGRNIHFSVFDLNAKILNPSTGKHAPAMKLTEDEWEKITHGETVVVRQDLKRFEQEVSLVALPYIVNGEFIGGILLTSPISGSREMVTDFNQFLIYTILIALSISFLLSLILSRIHVNRIKRIQEATSLVSAGNYNVSVPSSNFDEIGELAEDFNQMVKKLNASMEEIESLENRRRQFMADVSHEMRTPLTTISGVIEGLRSDMIPESEKERGIQLVSKETKRLIRLVNENLDYEKIRSNQVKLFKEEIQLLEAFEIIQEQLESQAADKNNQIMIDVHEEITVYADYDRLIQILINITKNSIQFTQDGTIWLKGRAENRECVIEIEDTGIGINPEDIENIWRRFYKADLSRTTIPYGEFGLGLSIVKKLIDLHDGQVEVTSKIDQGAKFTIRLPLMK